MHTPEFAFEHVLGNVRTGDARPARHVAGRARQRLRDVDGVLEPVLAGRLPDRQVRPRARLPLRRGRVRRDRARDPLAARAGGASVPGARRGRGRDADRAGDAGVVPRQRAARREPLRRLGDPPEQAATYTLRLGAPARRPLARRASGRSAPSGSSPGSARGSACTSARTTSTSCSAARARSSAASTASRPGRRVTSTALHLVSGSAPRDGLLELRFSPGVDAYAFTFG